MTHSDHPTTLVNVAGYKPTLPGLSPLQIYGLDFKVARAGILFESVRGNEHIRLDPSSNRKGLIKVEPDLGKHAVLADKPDHVALVAEILCCRRLDVAESDILSDIVGNEPAQVSFGDALRETRRGSKIIVSSDT